MKSLNVSPVAGSAEIVEKESAERNLIVFVELEYFFNVQFALLCIVLKVNLVVDFDVLQILSGVFFLRLEDAEIMDYKRLAANQEEEGDYENNKSQAEKNIAAD